jgi:hypothetical protein
MQKFKPLFFEIVWLGVILNVTVLVAIFVFGWTFLGSHFDIRLHETYFSISSWKIVLPLFVFFAFFIFLIKEIRHQFRRKASNIIMLVAGSILILLIAAINKQVIITEMVYFGGSSVFPSLSAMTELNMKKAVSPAMHVVSNSLTVIQFFVTISMLYVAYKMGRNYVAPVVTAEKNNQSTVNHTNNIIKPKAVPQVKAKIEKVDKLTLPKPQQ